MNFLGYVDNRKKWSFIKEAELLLMPLFLEGFELPVLESLKTGIPVVASSILVFKELYGNFIEYVDPNSPMGIARV